MTSLSKVTATIIIPGGAGYLGDQDSRQVFIDQFAHHQQLTQSKFDPPALSCSYTIYTWAAAEAATATLPISSIAAAPICHHRNKSKTSRRLSGVCGEATLYLVCCRLPVM